MTSSPPFSSLAADLMDRIRHGTAIIGVIGLGYVGLPLVRACRRSGLTVLGFDLDPDKVSRLNAGQSYIHHIPDADIAAMAAGGGFVATADFARLAEADVVLICVPTPLTRHREPDMTYVAGTAETIARHARPGQLVCLESTTYPGTTLDLLRPVLERGGLRTGHDLFLAFSPEREDPGNSQYGAETIPKVVGADDGASQALAEAFYARFVPRVVPVSSSATAEAVKLTENIFRAVNIALVNELKLVYEAMGIDIWEVIDTARTKPFGFMPFYPGPGLGGHCIPIDPFYLTWKARAHDTATRFIELAGEINTAMPTHVVRRLGEALDARTGRGLNGARILVLGAAYKKNVDDVRESPALRILELLQARGARADYYDPFVAEIPPTREHPGLTGRRSVVWEPAAFAAYDAAFICTDHDGVDYAALVAHCPLVVDARNATRHVHDGRDRIVKV